jgi:alkylation response protein AidB-like acyl-CoA dehydrogenase
MDFSLSPEQQQLHDELARFARERLRSGAREHAREGRFFEEGWRRCAEMDLFGMLAPTRYGGVDHDPVTCAVALEALGYGCEDNGFLLSLGVQILAGVAPLNAFGTEQQKDRFLRALITGKTISAFCATEAESGSDILSLRTRAIPDGKEIVLCGAKTFVTNAPRADLLLVLARDEQGPSTSPLAQLGVYLVERESPGLRVGPVMEKMGLEGAPMAEVALDDCRVPRDSRLGTPGDGYTIFNAVMQWERVLLPAIYVGIMRSQLERTCAHTKAREQFGQPLFDFQAVSHSLAEMKARLEASRLLVYRAAWLVSKGRQAALEGSLAKLVASESFKRNSQQALQLHGACGYMADLPLEQQLRDAVAATIYSGTSEVHRTIIARLIDCPS